MDLPALLAALADPAAYPRPGPVEVRQTHLSVAFLVGDAVYKVRKSVNLGYVDFTTLDRRKHDCDEEDRLNRRLAPALYRGVVPVTRADGRVRVDRKGAPLAASLELARPSAHAPLAHHPHRHEVSAP